MIEGIPYVIDQETDQMAGYVRWFLRERRRASVEEFRRRCEECRRLALDATPITAGERAQLQRELNRGAR